ncbi:MAG TPA: hypothetical protein VN648_05845 [Candidatus Methylomirabilis sp.]|nr:hypothetical protein [Candidatus Methylomirabilis sp.]
MLLNANTVTYCRSPSPPLGRLRLVENRAALLRVGHQRTVASVPNPAAPRARRLGSARGTSNCMASEYVIEFVSVIT